MLKYGEFLLEKRNLVSKIKKFANVPLIYEWSDEQDNNLSLWISNQVVNRLTKRIEQKNKKILPTLKKYLKGDEIKGMVVNRKFFDAEVMSIQHVMSRDLRRILDYVNSPLHNNRPKIKGNFKDALEKSDKWHHKIKNLDFVIEEESGTIIKKYPSGYYWIDLETTQDAEEGKAMGHCGTTNMGTTILSLRRYKQPHVTIAYDESGDKFNQIKGRGNDKPIEKYHEYIVDIICQLKVDGFDSEYGRSGDFDVEDLEPELLNKLKDCNPEYIENSKKMTDDEIEELYRSRLEDNWVEEASMMGRWVWEYVDDERYIENFVENEMEYYTGDGFSDVFDDEKLKTWINDEVVAINDNVELYFTKKYDEEETELRKNANEDDVEFKEDLAKIQEKKEKHVTDQLDDLDYGELEELLKDNADVDDLVKTYLLGQYSTAEDVYRNSYGDADDVDSSFIQNELEDYINSEEMIDTIMYDTDIDTMRETVE